MAKIPLLGIFLLYTSVSQAQFNDSFADGDYTSNPVWAGDNSKFVIDDFQLRLQAPAVAGSAFLSTPSESINDAVWELFIRLDFPTSGANLSRIYLVSDQPNLTMPLNGYFVMVGDTDDEISLYRQTGTTITKVIDGANGRINQSTVTVKVKATRDNVGHWELFSDPGATGTYISEGTAFENTHKVSFSFGVYCLYTATRSDKFYFDDFQVSGGPYVDTDPPVLETVDVLSSKTLLLHFNEVLESASASTTMNYAVDGGIGMPISAIIQEDQQSVELAFLQSFNNASTHAIMVSGIEDLSGNVLTGATSSFFFFEPISPQVRDIVITEIFADPSPQVALPDAEYIELFNRSGKPFNLEGWIFSDGSSKAVFPDKFLLPGDYLVITSNSNVSKFGINSHIIGVPNFPTLNNSSDTLTLKTPDNFTIDSLNYDLTWYRNIDKQEGGWSLELIDPNNLCSEKENWTSSENENGGTPGFINSVFASKPDLISPQLSTVTVQDEMHLLLTFNEKLETPLSSTIQFEIVPEVKMSAFGFNDKALRSIQLTLAAPILPRKLYEIKITNVFDCSGNAISEEHKKLTFALPEPGEPDDIIINEILFNPRPNGVDFVEIYNQSAKFINLKDWMIGNYADGKIENKKIISVTDLIVKPGDYWVFTADPINIKTNYPQGKENYFLKISMPSFPDDEGSIALATPEEALIDFFLYSKNFHSPFIKDPEGVSLERISFSEKTNDRENWSSASSTTGFGTPGFINSNFRLENIPALGEVTIDPPVFAPGASLNEFSQIHFRFNKSGFIGNVKVFDHQGRLIRIIANNALLNQEGFFRWDGDQEDGSKARAGYYLVWFEVFDNSGTIQTYRKRVVIASR